MLRYSSERHPKRLFRSQTKSAKVHPQNKHGHWKKTRATKTTYLGGGFKYLLISIPTWGRLPFWRAYFSNGLVQPPTRYSFLDLLVTSGVSAFYLHDEPLWCEGFRFQHLVNTEVFCADNPGKWRKFIVVMQIYILYVVLFLKTHSEPRKTSKTWTVQAQFFSQAKKCLSHLPSAP